jgi:DNA-binding transcriptional ArsR family regulator
MGSVCVVAVGVHGRRRVRAVSALDDLFSALSDPTRRALFDRLLRDGPDTATRLAQHTALTRQAVVKHLQALVDAGLAEPQRIGREVKYAATPEPLATVVAWLTESSRGWDRRTARLASVSRRLASDRRR